MSDNANYREYKTRIAMKFPDNIGINIRESFEKLLYEYKPKKIILFGSYAYGHPTVESDLDILIIKETTENPIKRRVTVRRLLNIKDPNYPQFSPIVVTPKELDSRIRIGDQFIKEIIEKGKVLYEK